MNTGKQVNVMIGLLFVFLIGTLFYFLWDNVRAEDAEERQIVTNAERGGKLFSLNCRACHGIGGLGPLENPTLPGIPLNVAELNRPQDPGKLLERQNRIRDTIRCGRVGTLMPQWAQDQGGPLNEFQIEQLVTLITGATPGLDPPDNLNAVSERGWEAAAEEADHADLLAGKRLARAVGPEDTVFILTDAQGLSVDGLLRIDDEVVKVVDAPASSSLLEEVTSDQTDLPVDKAGDLFQGGDIVQVGMERMRVVSASEDSLSVERGVGTDARGHRVKAAVFEPRDEITVERAAFGTDAAEHEDGAQLFAGPIEPPTGPLTGENGAAPCGQRGLAAPAPAETPAAPGAVPSPSPGQPQRPATAQEVQAELLEPTDGLIETESLDNSFTINNFGVKVGQEATIRLSNSGLNLHDLRVAGVDGEWSSDDDFATDILPSGQTDELTFSLDQPATLVFRCDVHPLEMWGQITVTE